MSYELSIQSDDEHSESAHLSQLEDWILARPGVRRNGCSSYVLDIPEKSLWMELDVEISCNDDDNVRFDCIRAHIPYENLGDAPETIYFPTLLGLANYLGWKVIDEQTGCQIRPE